MSARTSILAASALLFSAHAAKAEDFYFRGFLEVFSAGICAVGPGSCHSYLAVENVIADVCARRPAVIRVAGHSYGGSAAMRFVWGVTECGLRVGAAAFLDPQTHPFNIPAHTRIITLYSPAFAGAGEGKTDAQFVGGTHISMTFDASIHRRIRALFDSPPSVKKVKKP